ncbi:MAG: 30S ribosomal protein S15 [Candidatus Vidania fulgoroideorum]
MNKEIYKKQTFFLRKRINKIKKHLKKHKKDIHSRFGLKKLIEKKNKIKKYTNKIKNNELQI